MFEEWLVCRSILEFSEGKPLLLVKPFGGEVSGPSGRSTG